MPEVEKHPETARMMNEINKVFSEDEFTVKLKDEEEQNKDTNKKAGTVDGRVRLVFEITFISTNPDEHVYLFDGERLEALSEKLQAVEDKANDSNGVLRPLAVNQLDGDMMTFTVFSGFETQIRKPA